MSLAWPSMATAPAARLTRVLTDSVTHTLTAKCVQARMRAPG